MPSCYCTSKTLSGERESIPHTSLFPQVMPLRLFLDRLKYRGVPRGLGKSQSYDENISAWMTSRGATRSSRNKWRTTRRLKNIALSIRFVPSYTVRRARAQSTMGKEKWQPIDARNFGQGKRNCSRVRAPTAYGGLQRTSPQMM